MPIIEPEKRPSKPNYIPPPQNGRRREVATYERRHVVAATEPRGAVAAVISRRSAEHKHTLDDFIAGTPWRELVENPDPEIIGTLLTLSAAEVSATIDTLESITLPVSGLTSKDLEKSFQFLGGRSLEHLCRQIRKQHHKVDAVTTLLESI